jgi:hypothetical protein
MRARTCEPRGALRQSCDLLDGCSRRCPHDLMRLTGVDAFSDHEDWPEPDGAADGRRVLQVEGVSRRARRSRITVLAVMTLVGLAIVLVVLGGLQMAPENQGRAPARSPTNAPARHRVSQHHGGAPKHVLSRDSVHPHARYLPQQTDIPRLMPHRGSCGRSCINGSPGTEAAPSLPSTEQLQPQPRAGSVLDERTLSEFGFER